MYPGYNILERAVVRGDPVGVTRNSIDTRIDTGEIAQVQPLTVKSDDTREAILAKPVPVDGHPMRDAVRELEVGALMRKSRTRETVSSTSLWTDGS
jgi:methionyl-tRNA formyltransferase